MNRAQAVLAEWDAHIAAHGKAAPGEAKRDAAIAALFPDYEALRQRLAKDASSTVTPFRPRGPP
ncbi:MULTISPECIES: hypothetical protein [Streptomyces]|uniref:hypothetical protein n=1 Tax=Streptomyces TaxID=1883 RepID=UPI00081B2AB4|nr:MULTISPECIES: hypothetical protein [unclassified Streptomyces]MYQ55245.1 hypothetical protein [Streptomyces sp. SID4941]SCE34819.1 hypothetical protein GA0115247_132640 [Streptomyces sp. PalvLS-984]SDD19975.1 hypothetical protein F558DRAFT_03581 [Streptomyces sp. AmelKG-A3]